MPAPEPLLPLLQLRDLRVDVGGRNVLKSISLAVPAGALLVLMGANGSGKSTLGMALAGHPRYRVAGGSARFAGQDLLALTPEARARAGLFVSFQAPPEIPGVKNNLFVRSALNAVREARGEAPLDAFDFLADARATARRLGLPEAMLGRPERLDWFGGIVNPPFPGGERLGGLMASVRVSRHMPDEVLISRRVGGARRRACGQTDREGE